MESTGYFLIPQKMVLQHEYFSNFLQIKTYVNPKKLFFHFNYVQIGQPYDTLKSNNNKMTSTKDTDLTLFLDDKWLM